MRATFLPNDIWRPAAVRASQEDLLAAAIAAVAILMFVGIGIQAVPPAVAALIRDHAGPDRTLTTAMLLNIALVLFAMRRYKDAREERLRRVTAEQRAEVLASRDQLTNLLVLRSIGEPGSRMVEDARGRGQQVAMLVVNLDRFKRVNDVYGHIAGDAMLRAVADALLDITPPEALCARVGADEFAIMFTFCESGRQTVTEIAEHVVLRLGEPVEIGGTEVHGSASVGLARSASDCKDVDGLLRRANIAMHVAKESGGGRTVWFDQSMESALKARNEIESGLRRGIPLGEFVPYYQPQFDLASGDLCGFEVLARWQHPAGGVVGPDLFIPVAEETGLIGALFDSILHQALCDAREWHDRLVLSVNVSPGQLKDPFLSARILRILSELRFAPGRVEIEITESSLFENLAVAQSIVTSLKNEGVRLALDDFGTGYSSLAHLRALPFDRIKIDHSFVKSMVRDSGSLAIVKAVTSMGRSLGVPVTAEGVENAEAAAQLREIGCDKAQGWHFGKAAPVDETRELLAERRLLKLASIEDEVTALRRDGGRAAA